jgi:hypothetical protein
MWETCDIAVWGTTRDLGFPVTRDRDTVKSARDAAEGRQTNFIISPEILRFSRQVLEEWDPGMNPHSSSLAFYWHSIVGTQKRLVALHSALDGSRRDGHTARAVQFIDMLATKQ